MSQYYYLVAQLPFLKYEEGPPMEEEDFLRLCRIHLKGGDYAQLAECLTYKPERNKSAGIYRSWVLWETSLRNELVLLRSQKLKQDPAKYVHVSDKLTEPVARAREAFQKSTPLQAEEYLDNARWKFLDELETGHFFDLEKLVVYYMKLQVLNRRKKLEREAGLEIFDGIRAKKLHSILNGE